MTLLKPFFKSVDVGATTLTPRDDIITTDRILMSSYGGNINLGGDYTASYEEIVKKQLWVRIAVNKMAYTIGRLPLKTYQNDDTGRERVSDSPLAQLMRRPNESKETGHAAGFKARIAYDLYTYANSIIVKVQTRPDAVPSALIPFSPRGWTVNSDGDYVYREHSADEKRFKSWRIIHLIEPGPTVGGFGVSRLEAARLTLAIEYAAQRFGAATFENGARPGGVINVKGGLPSNPTERAAVMQRFKDEIKRRFGGVDKTGLPAVLEGDVSWLPMSHNLDDSAVVSHRQLTRMEVAALYDIPQPAMGILDEANFASIDALHLMFYQDSIGWPVNLIEETFETQLIDGVPEFEGQFLEFDLNAVLRGNPDARSQTYQRLISVGVMTQNEARAFENWKPGTQPEADQLHTPLFLSPNPAAKEADNSGGVKR